MWVWVWEGMATHMEGMIPEDEAARNKTVWSKLLNSMEIYIFLCLC